MTTPSAEPRIVVDERFGHRRVDPTPPEDALARFYESQYYDLMRRNRTADILRRLMAGGEEAAKERAWLHATIYDDIRHAIETHGQGRRVLDVGCGNGELVAYLAKAGFDAEGVEPSAEAVAAAQRNGLRVHEATFQEFTRHAPRQGAYDAVTIVNVLEHVPDPAATMTAARRLLRPGGLVVARVPNDFSDLQAAAKRQLGVRPWWVAVPQHLNYFDLASLQRLFRGTGFEPVYATGDFPMEMFLLMGENYVGHPEVGERCHEQQVRFETSIPPEVRRRMYEALGAVGIGRSILLAGQATGVPG